MSIEGAGQRLLLLLGEWRCRKLGEYLVQNERLHVRLCLFLLPKAVQRGKALSN